MSTNTPQSSKTPSIPQAQILFGVLFAGSLITANLTAAKLTYIELPILGVVMIPAGFIAIAVAFLCSDFMANQYGKEYAHKVVNATVITLGVTWALVWAAIYLPVAPAFETHEAYVQTLGSGSGIIAASIITVLVSQHIDINIFHRIHSLTGEGHRWARNLGSTSISQFVDTVLFITLAFAVFPTFFTGDPVYGVALLMMIFGQYAVKLGVAILDTPVFYAITSLQRYWDRTKANSPENTIA